jgi:hypothetical protein
MKASRKHEAHSEAFGAFSSEEMQDCACTRSWSQGSDDAVVVGSAVNGATTGAVVGAEVGPVGDSVLPSHFKSQSSPERKSEHST